MNRYFDANATTRICEESLSVWNKIETNIWHNPSGLYPSAAVANRRLEDARESLADLVGCDAPERIVFTSGATEANNAVFSHLVTAGLRPRILVSGMEHPSVIDPARKWFGEFAETIPQNHTGTVSPDALRALISKRNYVLVSVMAANNETGILQPWEEIREICAEAEIPFHCDAAQWLGKLPSKKIGRCDFVTGSAHKFRGPKGVGFLIIPEESAFQTQVGGPQEHGHRAGTENLAAIAAMVAALETSLTKSDARSAEIAKARDMFEAKVTTKIPGTIVAGGNRERLWNTSMLVMPNEGNLRWITRLGRLGIQASTGSACSAGKGKPSLSLGAMGFDFDQMGRALRFSADWDTSAEDWGALADALIAVSEDFNSKPKKVARRGNLLRPENL